MKTNEPNKAEIVEIATEMLEGRMNLIEGARRLCILRHNIDKADDPVFLPIRGFESDTEDYVTPDRRHLYSDDYLRRVDESLEEYLSDSAPEVHEACRQIILAFSQK